MEEKRTPVWAYMIRLGSKMWPYWLKDYHKLDPDDFRYSDPNYLLFDKAPWDETLAKLQEVGCNMLIIDLGEGMKFKSHPELAAIGSWEQEDLKKELDRIRSMGMTPVPKLNFSAGHDDWLGVYSRMVSTPTYYEVVADVIRETAEVFGHGYFHIGMDEETYTPANLTLYHVVRCHELWWEDFHFIADNVRKAGCTPMIWPDVFWHKKEEAMKNMSKDIIMCNWYYGNFEDPSKTYIAAYHWLADAGYQIMPTTTTWERADPENLLKTVQYCHKNLPHENILGFMMVPWNATIHKALPNLLRGAEKLAEARKEWDLLESGSR